MTKITNVFGISPGRTATMSLSIALSEVPGYTTGHETKTRELGPERVNYPDYHIEFDNRLVWFLPRLEAVFARRSVLLIISRDAEEIAESYNSRWSKVNMMRAYSQGVLLRRPESGVIEVCRDFVSNVYEHLDHARERWARVVDLSVADPVPGIAELLDHLGRKDDLKNVVARLQTTRVNQSGLSVKDRAAIVANAFHNLAIDLRECFRS